uniref:NADH-ubiquinone oxidoreductase chain 4 n=1 Tax=Capillaria sp. cat-2018 TaxID=2488633 RepID=A0A6M2UJ51_9BILA|nr:NADH dehydrogenase subunit 4 [Capillaria sp. cat-2018]
MLMVMIVLLMIYWLVSGYVGSVSLLMSSETKLSYFMVMVTILLFISYSMYFSYYNKNFEKLIYIYVFILLPFFTMNKIMYFYVFFELSIIPMYLLILGWGSQPERLIASNYLMLYTLCFSLPMLVMFLVLLNKSFSCWEFFMYKEFSWLFWSFLMLPFFIKMPVYLFHLWLPKAHVEAPVMGSMFLASILLKTGSYGMLKINEISFKFFNNNLVSIFFILVFSGSLMCIIQNDLKKFVAYSSVTHMTMIAVLLFSNYYSLDSGIITLMLAHGMLSNVMFFITGIFSNFSKTRVIFMQQNYSLIIPVMWYFLIMVLFLNSGLPPSLSMMSEMMLFINGSMNWVMNFLFMMLMFMALIYYPVWFMTMINSSKSFVGLVGNLLISDMTIVLFYALVLSGLWINMSMIL